MIFSRLFTALLFLQVISMNLSAQVITNGDGSPLTRKYCWENDDHEIAGQPAGGVFSGCGITQTNGQWYFNARAASNGITVFPYSCTLNYTVNGNTLSVSILVWKPVLVIPPLRDTSTCDGHFNLEAEMLYAGDYDYSWMPAANLNTPAQFQTSGHIDQTTTFVVMARDQTSGCTGSDTVVITRLGQPQINVCNDTTLLARTTVRLMASGADHYEWSPRQWLDTFTAASPLATPEAPVTYTVTGTSEAGCTATATVRIDLIEDMLIPNAFSPNGDGINDEFRIVNLGYQHIKEFRVFNRWGEQVFNTMDGATGWNGNYKGQAAEPGTYPYYIRMAFRDGTQKVFKGDVTLIR